ncbi:hypothetical protein GTY54_07465 [Streptomyces sp. SID625]|nr:hypothetical protein [Streptomyces sp. SID625]
MDRLRALGTRIGAVYTDGTNWRFFTPPETHTLSWPPPVLCLSGPVLPIPPRAARGPRPGLWWITRGEPCGRLWTPPILLWAVLTALMPQHDLPAQTDQSLET